MLEFLVGMGLSFGLGYWLGKNDSKQKYDKPIRLVSRNYVSPAQIASPTNDEGWRLAITSFAFKANMNGSFSYRSCASFCRRHSWEVYSDLLADGKVIIKAERSRTWFAPGWGYPRLRVELKRNILNLNYPLTPPPPLLPTQ